MLTPSAFLALALQCAPAVHPSTLYLVVKAESSLNPYAIGVKDGALPRQPRSREEALAAVRQLVKEGKSFAVGLGQIHRRYFDASDPREVAEVFEPCRNLRLSGDALRRWHARALPLSATPQEAIRKAISGYYSGNFTSGFRPEAQFGGTSHVERVLAHAGLPDVPALEGPDVPAAPVLGKTPQAPDRQAREPTYQSWDVLRQYPRYERPVAPEPAAPPQSIGDHDGQSEKTQE